jgi:hypothetical protein
MRRFFLALRVGGQHVAGPLPGVLQRVQLPADRGLGDALALPALQVLPEQGDGPLHRLVAEVGRPLLQGGGEGRLEVLGPEGGTIAPAPVGQGRRVARLAIAVDPVVHADSARAKQPGDFGNGPPSGRLQDGQGTAEEVRVGGASELLFEPVPLCRGELEVAHGAPQ